MKLIIRKMKSLFDKNSLELIHHSNNYFSVELLIAVVSILSLPIITRLLTPYNYGIVSIFISFTNLFTILFTFGLASAIKINYIKKDYPHREYLFSNIIFLLFINIIILITIFLFNNTLNLKFNLPESIILLATITSLCNVFIRTKLQLLQAKKKSKKYSLIYGSKQISTIIFSILVIYLMSNGSYEGWIYAMMCITIITFIYSFISLLRESRPSFNIDHIKDSLKYGLPLLPAMISGFILTFFDQIIISQLIGATQTGLYSLAYRVGSFMNLIVMSMNRSWQPIYWELIKHKEWDDINKLAHKYANIIYLSAIGLILFSREILILIADPKYYESLTIIPIIVLSYAFVFLYTLFAGISFYKKRTGLISLNTMIAAGTNIYLNYLLIPKYGYQIAAWTTLLSYILLFVLHYLNSRYILKYDKLMLKSVMPNFALVVFIFFISMMFNNQLNGNMLVSIILKGFIFILCGIYLFRKYFYIIMGILNESHSSIQKTRKN